MDLINDTELKNIYNYEKELFTSTFPDEIIAHVEYFLNDNNIIRGVGRGRNETTAESSALTNTYCYDEELKTRGILLQQYFPKTIAYIANKTALANRE